MGYNSVDFSELKDYCNNFKTTQEAFALDCESLRLKFKAFKEMESFQGKAAVSAKNQVEQVEDVLLNAIDKAANVYNSQLQAMCIDFSIVVDPADVVRADEGVLLDLNKRIKQVHFAFFNTSKGICSRVDALRATYPDYSITKPKYGSAIRDFEKLAGASGYSGSGLVHEGGMINQQWKDMAYFDRAHYGDLADIDLNSLCDKIEKILTESEQNTTNTDISKNINEFDTNIFSVNKEMVDGLQEFCDSLDPASAYAAQLVEMYKAELRLKDENGDSILNINKIQEIMRRKPSEVSAEQYSALMELITSLNENEMEQFIGTAYVYQSDDLHASYQLSEVFINMASLYLNKVTEEINNVEDYDWYILQGDAEKEKTLEEMSKASLLASLCEVGNKIFTSVNSPRPENFGELFLPIKIERGTKNYHDYHAKFFNNFSQYPYHESIYKKIDVYGLREPDNLTKVISDDVVKQLEGQVKTTSTVVLETIYGESLDAYIEKVGATVGKGFVLLWKGAKLVIAIDEAKKHKTSIEHSISAVNFLNIATLVCASIQFTIVDHQFVLDEFYINEKALSVKLNFYNKFNEPKITIEDIKKGFSAILVGETSDTIDQFSDWFNSDNYDTKANDYEDGIQQKVSAFGAINLKEYKDLDDDELCNGVPLGIIRELQKEMKKENIKPLNEEPIKLTPEVIKIADEIWEYQKTKKKK